MAGPARRLGSRGCARRCAGSRAVHPEDDFGLAFGGNVFGCPSVPPESSKPLTKGTGANHWSATGFQVKGASKDFGQLTLTYKNGKLSGGGSNPPCAAGLKWSITGAFTATAFNGKVNITLPSGQAAVSDISLKRS